VKYAISLAVQEPDISPLPKPSAPLAALSVQYAHSLGVLPVVFCNAIQDEPRYDTTSLGT
jgi:hypothetical protein